MWFSSVYPRCRYFEISSGDVSLSILYSFFFFLPSARCQVSWPIYQAIFLEEKCWFDFNKISELIPFMFHVWLFSNTKSVNNYPEEEEVEGEEEEEEDRRRRQKKKA